MDAPATPGTSDSGSAAGSDSEQGSDTEQQPSGQVTLTLLCDNDYVQAPTGSGTYEKGTTVTIEAKQEVIQKTTGDAGYTYTFEKWSDGDTSCVREIVLNEDLTLTAEYDKSFGYY